tara:strand:- start:53 stop:349 length:297 start_codon:yes stop_codon:yes gene_type:complete
MSFSPVGQMDKASAYGAEDSGFDSQAGFLSFKNTTHLCIKHTGMYNFTAITEISPREKQMWPVLVIFGCMFCAVCCKQFQEKTATPEQHPKPVSVQMV